MSSRTSDQLRSELRAIVARLSGWATFANDLDVFAASIVSSMNLLELIVAIEDAYGITIAQRDVFDGNLRSIDRMAELVAARTAV